MNSIGPEGRGGVGLGDGDAAATASVEGSAGATAAGCLQDESRRPKHIKRRYREIIIVTKRISRKDAKAQRKTQRRN